MQELSLIYLKNSGPAAGAAYISDVLQGEDLAPLCTWENAYVLGGVREPLGLPCLFKMDRDLG